jgi:hypothetical protein
MEHLDALRLRLSSERLRLASAGSENERALRDVWAAQIEREIAAEWAFLAKSEDMPELNDEELLAALGA